MEGLWNKMKFYPIIFSLLTFLLAACGGRSVPLADDQARSAPQFTLPNSLGGEISLSDYAGQPVFLFFHMAVG